MAKRIDRNQVFGPNGNLISEEVVEVIEYPTAEESAKLAARLIVMPKLAADELKDADAEAFAGLFPDWEPGIAVAVGEVYRWDGTLVQVIQAHTTQADWAPDVVPALFKIHRTATDTPQPWVQPAGGHDAYNIGDKVTFEGATYESTISANVWSPTAYPAGWRLI